ncbi:MAG: hypothetical protein JO257_30910 [Deltaproteobacteria bacterium]|nr:hypothetical protein [Deltaproteobacteria bacterium]
MRRLVALALAACHPRAPAPPPIPSPGISIAVYDTFSIVDDRRDLDVDTGRALVLDRLEPGVSLASLQIESDLDVGACHRELAGGSSITCAVTGARGRHRVRLVYATTAIHYTAQHAIFFDAQTTKARVASAFEVRTPAWGGRADVAIYDAAPGGEHAPHEVARRDVPLDGTAATFQIDPHDVPGALRDRYDRAPTDEAADPGVWVWLELPGTWLPPGDIRVTADSYVALLSQQTRKQDATALRLPLHEDPDLQVTHQGAQTRITSTASAAREVWFDGKKLVIPPRGGMPIVIGPAR